MCGQCCQSQDWIDRTGRTGHIVWQRPRTDAGDARSGNRPQPLPDRASQRGSDFRWESSALATGTGRSSERDSALVINAGNSTEVCLSYKGSKTNCQNVPVLAAATGVFTVDGIHAAALNQDGTVNSADHRAPPGSIVAVFATGLGPIQPAQADGSLVEFPLPMNVLGVQVFDLEQSPAGPQNIPLEVTYAGPAPYIVAGVSQVNFKTPSGNGQTLLTVQGQDTTFQVYVDQ